jgi:hypothetical protein
MLEKASQSLRQVREGPFYRREIGVRVRVRVRVRVKVGDTHAVSPFASVTSRQGLNQV